MILRDRMHRCPVCKKLFLDTECILETNEDGLAMGLQCPNKCVPVFEQPAYELPINDVEND